MVCFMIYLPLSVLEVDKISLRWLLNYMFNVTDGRDRNFGVDFYMYYYSFPISIWRVPFQKGLGPF